MFRVSFFKYWLMLVILIPYLKTIPIEYLSNSSSGKKIVNIGPLFQLSTTTTWQEFEVNSNLPELKQKKWAWISMITLKSKIPLKLKTLQLQWQGKKIENLQASLYQKRVADQNLIPIEQNLVCDGIWDSMMQSFTFNINQKIVAINDYYLVLSFPIKEESSIKSGRFTLPNQKSVYLTKLE